MADNAPADTPRPATLAPTPPTAPAPSPVPTKALIVWKGEGEDGPRATTWRGIVFKIGEPVEVDDPHMIAKAKTNRFFEVVEDGPTYGARPRK